MINRFINIAADFVSGIRSVAFPRVCLCCGTETTEMERQVCSFCKQDRFETANPDYKYSSKGLILPESVNIQHALWQYDKGGLLQDLMHYLKYERLTGIGHELGATLGESMKRHPGIVDLIENSGETWLIPVPLHFLKFRKRGFNQAYFIAKGIQEVLNLTICDVRSVVRKKNTRSQTGFSIQKRISNMKDAFQIYDREAFKNKVLIVVDDVFTTGSTTFELSGKLKEAGCGEIIIATVAQA